MTYNTNAMVEGSQSERKVNDLNETIMAKPGPFVARSPRLFEVSESLL